MATETPKVTRDGTMEVTAKEGIAYLEKEKPDLANQIKQQLKDEQAEKPANGSGDATESNGTTKVVRDNTMVQTAEEGLEFLRRQAGGVDVIKDHGLDKLIPDAIPEDQQKTPKIPQDRTMVETAKEGKQFLEKEGGVNEDAKTRAQEKELNDSKSEEKEATKRSADDETEEADEAKKQKVEGSNGDEPKKDEEPAVAEQEESKE